MLLIENIISNRLVSVIRADNLKEALCKAEACIEGGIRLIEVTYSFPDTSKAVKILSSNKDLIVGVGTVLNIEQAESALESGARFLVSPHTDRTLIEYSLRHKIVSIAGATTSNEVVSAYQMGADFVKIFPVNLIGGPEYIKSLKEPLPFIKAFVTGGINKFNITDYINAGVSLIGISSALFGDAKFNEKQFIEDRAKELIALVKSIDNSYEN
jgi:2-dehydro-3-deoxyphosphogluconate aldolase / (4S)-4-hydroxy-2-oxoglutarate aldolase